VPYVDATSAELLFRHKVIAFLRDEELLSEERIELLLSWQNTGFLSRLRATAITRPCARGAPPRELGP
jgi:hypothetical protein